MKRRNFNLQLFAEGEGSEAGNAPQTEAVVVYGKEPAGDSVTTDNPPAMEETFDDLIKGRYKADYENKLKSALGGRMKGVNEKLARYEGVDQVMKVLAVKYGQNPEAVDYKELARLVESDDEFYERIAEQKGISTGELKLQMENDRLRALQERQREEENSRANYEKLVREAEGVKEFYPNFDLSMEMQNREFGRLIKAGIGVRQAYEVTHRDEINTQLMQYAAQRAQEQVANTVKSNLSRPQENGAGNVAPVVYKNDPSKFTKEDRKSIKERVRRGEKITFD